MVWLALTCAAVGVFISVGICAGNHILLLVPSLMAAVYAISLSPLVGEFTKDKNVELEY